MPPPHCYSVATATLGMRGALRASSSSGRGGGAWGNSWPRTTARVHHCLLPVLMYSACSKALAHLCLSVKMLILQGYEFLTATAKGNPKQPPETLVPRTNCDPGWKCWHSPQGPAGQGPCPGAHSEERPHADSGQRGSWPLRYKSFKFWGQTLY